ncbi:MAG: hypothetical protein ACRELS_04780 [Candidatus Rokuibacteriota bacterium]
MAETDPAGALHRALFGIAHLLDAEGVAYMIVGALAVAMWGEPRATADIDVTLRGDAERLDALAARAVAEGFALDREWLEWQPLLRDRQRRLIGAGAIVDLMRPRDAHEEGALERRRYVLVEGRQLPFAAPDDLILMKMKAGRPRDFEDASSVLAAQRATIDELYLADWARRLGVEDELSYLLREGG